MISMKISNRLQRRIDQIEVIPIRIKSAIDMGILLSVDEVQDQLYSILGDKAEWFTVDADPLRGSLLIRATDEAGADSEKMRYVVWAVQNHGEQIHQVAKEIVNRKTLQHYRGEFS